MFSQICVASIILSMMGNIYCYSGGHSVDKLSSNNTSMLETSGEEHQIQPADHVHSVRAEKPENATADNSQDSYKARDSARSSRLLSCFLGGCDYTTSKSESNMAVWFVIMQLVDYIKKELDVFAEQNLPGISKLVLNEVLTVSLLRAVALSLSTTEAEGVVELQCSEDVCNNRKDVCSEWVEQPENPLAAENSQKTRYPSARKPPRGFLFCFLDGCSYTTEKQEDNLEDSFLNMLTMEDIRQKLNVFAEGHFPSIPKYVRDKVLAPALLHAVHLSTTGGKRVLVHCPDDVCTNRMCRSGWKF